MSDAASPQEELRQEIEYAVASLRLPRLPGDIANALLPLFAARVAAIEAELAEHQRVYGQMLDNVAERGRQRDLAIEEQAAERKRAERAEAERTVYLARSVALEHELAEVTANLDAAGDELQAAWRATGEISQRVAAERTQAAAQAWQHAADFIGMNCSCSDRLLDADPYREATP